MIEPEHSPSDEPKIPFISLRDAPLLIVAVPLMFLVGAHVALIAMGLRKLTRIPYAIWMVTLYGALTAPLIIYRDGASIYVPLVAAVIVQLALLTALLIANDRDEWMNGTNLEIVAAPHILTVLAYIILPAIYAATQRAA